MQQLMSEMDDDVPTIKFGDASVAAPFTSKISSVKSVCGIIRQGRATLVNSSFKFTNHGLLFISITFRRNQTR
jgi:manganese-transporting P-type ATPase